MGSAQPGPDGSHPLGAVSPGAKAGSGQGHGQGSGVCGPQRWHSPAPARPGPLGLPGGPPASQPGSGGWAGGSLGRKCQLQGGVWNARSAAGSPSRTRTAEGRLCWPVPKPRVRTLPPWPLPTPAPTGSWCQQYWGLHWLPAKPRNVPAGCPAAVPGIGATKHCLSRSRGGRAEPAQRHA